MDAKNIVVSVVSIAIACLFAVTLLIPVIADSTAETETIKNEGYFRLSSIDKTDDSTITMVWDHTKPEQVTVNDVVIPITYPDTEQVSVSLLFSDSFTVRFFKQFGLFTCQAFLPYSAFVGASVTNSTDLVVTATSGTITVTNTAVEPSTGTATYDTLYYPSLDGAWTMKKMDVPAYVFPDSTIVVANGLTNVGANVLGIYFDGNIDDGYEFTIYRSSGDISDVVSVYTDDSSHVDVVKLDHINFTITKGDDVVNATYSYFLVPYEVTAEKTYHPDESTTALLNIIPLFVVMGIILGAVGLIAYRRL